MTTPFRLADLVTQVSDESGEIGPAEVAKLVLDAIPDESRDDALAQAMTAYVRHRLSRDRPAAGFTAPLRTVAAVNSARSSRVRGIRLAYLNAGYSTGPGQRKRLGDCTARDLRYIADGLTEQAERLQLKAEDMNVLASQLEEKRVATVRELPDDVLRLIFSA
jgi:hypothetical protein